MTAPAAAPRAGAELGRGLFFALVTIFFGAEFFFDARAALAMGEKRLFLPVSASENRIVRSLGETAFHKNKKAPRNPERFLEKFVRRNRARLASAPAAAVATATTTTTAAAVTAATATVAATATAAVTATAVAATAAAATGRTRFAWTRFVHGQRPAFNGLAVKVGDRLLRIGFAAHRDEGKAARFAGEFILHEGDFRDGACLREEVLKIGFGGIEGKISHVEFCAHLNLFFLIECSPVTVPAHRISNRH
jgi:hypothetical protein